MAFFRTIRNTLFGVDKVPTGVGSSAQESAKLARSAKLTTDVNSLDTIIEDPLKFQHFMYPMSLNTKQNGHYIKFDIFQNNLSQIRKEHKKNEVFSNNAFELAAATGDDFLNNILRRDDTKAPLEEGTNTSTDGLAGEIDIRSTDEELKQKFTNSQTTGILNKPREIYKSAKGNTEKMNQMMDLHSHTHQNKSSLGIILYTPSEVKFETRANYENSETGFLSDFLGKGSLSEAIGQGLAGAGTKLAGAAITTALEIVVPGAGGFFNRSTGMSVNPNIELAFKSVPFRPFSMSYDFAPKNKKEMAHVHKIIQMFRFHMSPALIGQTAYFASPSQFMITYMYRQKENNYIPKIAKCVLESLDVDYAPGEKFTTFEKDATGASPQRIKVQMTFREISIITKETIAEGY